MKNNPLIKDHLLLKKKAVALLSKAIAQIILKFRLPRSDFLLSLDESLVLEAKKQDPEASNVSIAIRTGIDRRYITRHLNGETIQSKPDKLTVILEDIHWTSHKFYQSSTIPKHGPFRTFQSICEQRASGTLTFNSILEELISDGNIKDLGDKIELIDLKTNVQSNISYSNLTAIQINRIVSTVIFNCNTEESTDKYVQRTVYSTQINPTKFNSLHNQIKLKTESFRNDINDLMMSYEDDVNVGTYPEYGYSFLEYKLEE